MNGINRVRIDINGSKYLISTGESEEYVKSLALELDDQLRGLMQKNGNMSFNDALIICALGYVDSYKKSEQNADNLRTQITEYLEDAARARIEVDEAKREINRLEKALAALKAGQNR